MEKILKNFHKDKNINIIDLVDKYLNELIKGGTFDLLFPIKKSYKFLANKWRKNNCNKESRPLKLGEFHPYCENYTGPGTRLKYNLKNNIKPISEIDKCSKKHDIQYNQYFKIKNNKERKNKIREADKEVIKCYDNNKNDKAYSLARYGIFGKTKLEDISPKMAKNMLGLYRGKEFRGGVGSEYSISPTLEKSLKYKICDSMFCFSYYPQNKYSMPIAKIGNNFVYINREGKHNTNCEGKLLLTNDINEKFELVPNLNKDRDLIYISAPSESGKTYFAKEYAKKYLQIFPKREIYIFSKKKSDDSIDELKPKRFDINDEDKLEDYKKLDYDMFKNSIVIFDDIENLGKTKELNKEIMRIASEIMNIGRDENITIIMISHMPKGGYLTKNILSEANVYVLFPRSGESKYEGFLKDYVGLDKKKARQLLKTKSRYLIIFKECPKSFMTENKIIMNMIDDSGGDDD